MSSSKAFVLSVMLRDALVDMKGLSPEAKGVFTQFWYMHELHREPLPPREEKIPVSEWDEWFRDKLDMKNVRTWRRIRDELLARAKIRQADDGRLYIARTMRAVERKRGGDLAKWGGSSDDDDAQGGLGLAGAHWAQSAAVRAEHAGAEPVVDEPVDTPVGDAGELSQSGELRANFGQSSPDHRPNWRPNPLIWNGSEPALSYSNSKSSHELLLSPSLIAARARGDP